MWNELQAFDAVLKFGTVSAAADELDVHRATVIRRIEALEAFVGGKLFYRHRHGYTPTDLGQEIALIAANTRAQLDGIRRRALNQHMVVEGTLIVTSVDGVGPFILRKIAEFTKRHKGIQVEFIAANSLLQLELAEAHVAIRLGRRPTEPDYIVLPFAEMKMGLFATEDYISHYGMPNADNLSGHRFVVPNVANGEDPPYRWLQALIGDPDLVLLSNQTALVDIAVKAGVGIGFVPMNNAKSDPP